MFDSAQSITGVVLAGGASRRFGRDKRLLKHNGKPLVQHVVDTMSTLFERLIVVARDPGELPPLAVPVIADLVPDGHALGGLYSGLASIETTWAFVCAADQPLLDPSTIRWICGRSTSHEAVVPIVGGRHQTLHALYNRSIVERLAQRLARRQLKLFDLIRELDTMELPEEALVSAGLSLLSFTNINTPEDWQTLQSVLKRSPEG